MKLLQQTPREHSRTPWKIGIVTGLSDPATCELSIEQTGFMNRVISNLRARGREIPVGSRIESNFPFFVTPGPRRKNLGLLASSYNNFHQFRSFRSVRYQSLARPHWRRLFESTDCINLIAGSCGLELIARSIVSLNTFPRIYVLALGPVANRSLVRVLHNSGQIRLTIVRGASGWIATRGILQDEIVVPKLEHLGYWRHSAIGELVCEWLATNISEF